MLDNAKNIFNFNSMMYESNFVIDKLCTEVLRKIAKYYIYFDYVDSIK